MKSKRFLQVGVLLSLLLPASQLRAGALVSANGAITEIGMHDSQSGEIRAVVDVREFSPYDDFYIAAAVVRGPHLSATAEAHFANDPLAYGAVGSANAEWIDRLTLKNPDLLYAYYGYQDVLAHLVSSYHGSVHLGQADISTNVRLPDGTLLSREHSISTTTSDPLIIGEGIFNITLPAYIFGESAGATVDYLLNVQTDNQIARGQTASVAFGNTFELMLIYFTDANGNVIPELADLQIVGDSGFVYPTSAVPEPASMILLLLGLLVCIAVKRVA